MKFAPVLPSALYHSLDFGNYHLVQAHMLEGNPGACEVVANWSKDPEHFVILDNGAAELDTPAIESLVRVASYLKPNEIVCPDVINNALVTIEMFKKYAQPLIELTDGELMIVPQGESLSEWAQCAEHMIVLAREFNMHPTVGISKFREPERALCLSWLVSYCTLRRWTIPEVHLLGIHDSTTEVENAISLFPWIRGNDSSLPWAQACAGSVGPVKVEMQEEWWHVQVPTQEIYHRYLASYGYILARYARIEHVRAL